MSFVSMCKDWWKLLGLYLFNDRNASSVSSRLEESWNQYGTSFDGCRYEYFLKFVAMKLTRKTIFTWNIVLEFISHSCIMNARNTSLVRSAFRFHDRLTHPSWKEMLIHGQFFPESKLIQYLWNKSSRHG